MLAPCSLLAATTVRQNIDQINQEIADLSQKISVLTVGSNITDPFKAELQDVQTMVTQANGLSDEDAGKAQAVIDIAKKKLEKLNQLVDLTNGSEDDLDSDNAAELQGIKQNIDAAQLEINKISVLGTDVTNQKNIIQDVKSLVSQAQDAINNHNMQLANVLIRKAQDRLDNLSESIDGVLGIDFDGGRKLARDYANMVSDVAVNLKSLSELDSQTAKNFENAYHQQNDSIGQVQKAITNISARHGFWKFLFGANFGAVADLKKVTQQNHQSIEDLKTLRGKVADPAMGAVMQNQIQTMSQQTSSLEVFIQNNEGGYSLLGWFLKYL